jgi:hypothetical protein
MLLSLGSFFVKVAIKGETGDGRKGDRRKDRELILMRLR